jgi:hypothetical protein
MEMKLNPETAEKLDQIVPPGSAVANYHNNSGWMKQEVSLQI